MSVTEQDLVEYYENGECSDPSKNAECEKWYHDLNEQIAEQTMQDEFTSLVMAFKSLYGKEN